MERFNVRKLSKKILIAHQKGGNAPGHQPKTMAAAQSGVILEVRLLNAEQEELMLESA